MTLRLGIAARGGTVILYTLCERPCIALSIRHPQIAGPWYLSPLTRQLKLPTEVGEVEPNTPGLFTCNTPLWSAYEINK